jgi:RNA polymerase sigma factor (sigma-70 family)
VIVKAGEDEAKAQVVRLRYFAGLNIEQTANILGISVRTVKRYWAYARAWLLCEIE